MEKKCMNITKFLVAGVLTLALCEVSWSQAPGGARLDTEELIALQHRWTDARVKRDVAFLENLYSKEFRITSMNGSVVTRAEDIAVFASGEMKPAAVTDEDMEVLLYDDVAIVRGIENMEGTYKGVFGKFSARFTNVFVKRDGRWQLVTHHSTEIRRP